MNISFQPYLVLILIVLTFLSCSDQDKKDASDFFLKGNQALTQGNYTEALRLYDEAIDKNKEFSDAYLNKGICLMKLDRVADAYDVLTQAINIDATLVQAMLVRAEAGLLTGRLNEAEADLRQIQKDYKDSSRFFLAHGNLMDARGQTSNALSDYDKAVSLNRANVEALVNRGAIQYRSGLFDQAKVDFISALKLNPTQPEALNNLGLIAIKNQDWEKAISYFNRILNSDPADPLALNNKGYALISIGQMEEARKLIERSLDILPSNGYALRNMGIYYQNLGSMDKALAQFNKAIELAEPVEELYGLTGKAYFSANDKTSACKIWKQGIILNDSVAIAQHREHCK